MPEAPLNRPAPPLRTALAMWAIAAAAYMSGFFLRVSPGVLHAELMRDFGLNAAGLGNLASCYFYLYAASQIPTGIANDRWGPKALIVFGTAFTGFGSMLFALAPNVGVALLARGMIGLGHGVAWVSLLEISARWFAPRIFGTMSGLSLAVGTLGAVLAQAPLLWFSQAWGWRWALAAVGVVCLVLSMLAARWIRNAPREAGWRDWLPPPRAVSAREVARGLREVWRWSNTWLLFVVPSGVCGAFLTFTTLWGAPFLIEHRGLGAAQASGVIAAMLVAFSVGSIAWGRLSDRWRRRKLPYAIGSSLCLNGFAMLTLWPLAPWFLLLPALLAAAAGAGAMALGFVWAKESVPQRLAGTATGVHNTGVMLGPLLQLPLLGWVLDRCWDGRSSGGVRLYSLQAFQVAFGILLAWVALSLVCLLLARESHARPYAGADAAGGGARGR